MCFKHTLLDYEQLYSNYNIYIDIQMNLSQL